MPDLSPWPPGPPITIVKGSTTWTPEYQQWLSNLRSKVNTPIPTTFANLPANPAIGQLAMVSDSSTAVWGAAIAGGGATTVMGFWNGTAWTVLAV